MLERGDGIGGQVRKEIPVSIVIDNEGAGGGVLVGEWRELRPLIIQIGGGGGGGRKWLQAHVRVHRIASWTGHPVRAPISPIIIMGTIIGHVA
jgi:hypothetical protein